MNAKLALSERDSCVCILEMRAEAMHGSIIANCAVGTKYYLAVRSVQTQPISVA